MNDNIKLALLVGTSTAVNGVYNVRNGKDPIPALIGSGLLFVSLSVVGALTNRWQLPIAFAWVFLLASLLMRGVPLAQSATQLASSPRPTVKPSPSASSSTGGSTGKGYSGGGGGGGGGGGW